MFRQNPMAESGVFFEIRAIHSVLNSCLKMRVYSTAKRNRNSPCYNADKQPLSGCSHYLWIDSSILPKQRAIEYLASFVNVITLKYTVTYQQQ